jgi:hypothetical protein
MTKGDPSVSGYNNFFSSRLKDYSSTLEQFYTPF